MHYLNTFKAKPAALKHSLALSQNPVLYKLYYQYFTNYTKEFIQLLEQNKNKEFNELCSLIRATGAANRPKNITKLTPLYNKTLKTASSYNQIIKGVK